MTLEKCTELIKILKSEILDENTPAEQKEFNKEWIGAIKKSISVSFEKSINKAEKRHQRNSKKIF